jgi:dipeptidyl aminopeptidase/acylaminoacyl peptidase
MSVFNKEAFLNSSVTGSNETKVTFVPEGEYTAYVDDLELSSGNKDGRDWYSCKIKWYIPDENLKKALGLEHPTVSDSIFLDIENGALAFGVNKNVGLGRIREALNQNDPKKPWSFSMMKGAGPVRIKVGSRPDKNNPGDVYPTVDRVAKA